MKLSAQAIRSCILWALACSIASFVGAPANALTLNTAITAPPNGAQLNQFSNSVSIQGSLFNSDPEGALVPGGLRAFYYIGDAQTAQPVPNVPASGIGRNSEFAANAQNSSNWWVTDTTAFRAANGIAGVGTNEFLPPYQMGRYLNAGGTTNTGTGFNDQFTVRMEGKINIPSSGVYNFSGGADDRIRVNIDGRMVSNNGNSKLSGNVFLTAGTHGITSDFVEFGGGQFYNFNLPGGATLSANAVDQHTFAGGTLEVGHNFQEQRVGFLTARVNNNTDGSGSQVGAKFHYAGPTSDDFGNGGVRAGDPTDSFRLTLTGYWNAAGGTYDFSAGADDQYVFAMSTNPLDNPNTVPRIIDNDGGTPGVPGSLTGMFIPAGLYPVRFEFGEGGGGANFNFQYKLNGGGSQLFPAADLRTTADLVFDYELLKTFNSSIVGGELLNWAVPESLQNQLLTLRLRAYGSDLSFSETLSTFQLSVVPEPSTAMLLGIGLMGLAGYNRRRRAARVAK